MGVINVGTIENQETIIEELGQVSEKTSGLGDKFSLINSTIGSDNPVPLDTIILQAVYGNVFEYNTAGTYELLIPASVSKIKVTACGAGGGGGGAGGIRNVSSNGMAITGYYGSGGGGGGDAIVDEEFTVTPQSTLTITVGKGGKATSYQNGEDGGATVIGDLVTLAGGHGGIAGTKDNTSGTGGLGSGNGGNGGIGAHLADEISTKTTITATAGRNGLVGNGGPGTSFATTTSVSASAVGIGGGGGGSLGNGGGGNTPNTAGTNPTKGGGGGGGAMWYNGANTRTINCNGADGYVKISWGY